MKLTSIFLIAFSWNAFAAVGLDGEYDMTTQMGDTFRVRVQDNKVIGQWPFSLPVNNNDLYDVQFADDFQPNGSGYIAFGKILFPGCSITAKLTLVPSTSTTGDWTSYLQWPSEIAPDCSNPSNNDLLTFAPWHRIN